MLKDIFRPLESAYISELFPLAPLEGLEHAERSIALSSADFGLATSVRRQFSSLSPFCNVLTYDHGYLKKPLSQSGWDHLNGQTNTLHIHLGGEDMFQNFNFGNLGALISNRMCQFGGKKVINIAHQRHLARLGDHDTDSKYTDISNGLSLGQIRHNVQAVEPILRYVEVVQFDTAALRYMESGAESRSAPTGLYAEEACQLMRYIGEGVKLNLVNIRAEDPGQNNEEKAMLIAQMIWYLVEGFSHRSTETPDQDKTVFDSYLVDISESDVSLHFCKHKTTNKWWASLENQEKYVPCSYEDYTAAVNGDLNNNLILLL